MTYTLKSGNTVIKYKSFTSATDKLVKLGIGKIYAGSLLVGEL